MIGEDFCNTRINIGVQLHHIPFELRNQMSAMELTAIARKVKDISILNLTSESQYGEEFLKFHIELDTTKQITPRFFLQRQGRKLVQIHLKYVKLPSVCFNCGKFNHDSKLCTDKKGNGSNLFGKWLRADDQSWNISGWPEDSASFFA